MTVLRTHLPSTTTNEVVPAGNQLVQRACACGGKAGVHDECEECRRRKLLGQGASLLQPKLRVGPPGDKYEQEADRVAESVMRMPAGTAHQQSDSSENAATMQPALLGMAITPLTQRQPLEEEEEEAQAKAMPGWNWGTLARQVTLE